MKAGLGQKVLMMFLPLFCCLNCKDFGRRSWSTIFEYLCVC